jgi:hypothetical protein
MKICSSYTASHVKTIAISIIFFFSIYLLRNKISGAYSDVTFPFNQKNSPWA